MSDKKRVFGGALKKILLGSEEKAWEKNRGNFISVWRWHLSYFRQQILGRILLADACTVCPLDTLSICLC